MTPAAATAATRLGAQDLHAHTTLSDGDLPPERVARLAAERGVTVGIADHISTRNPDRFIATENQLRRYLDALEGLPVYRSGEFCWCDTFGAGLPAELLERFDYRIGSNHGFPLPGGLTASPWWATLPTPWDERPDELMDVMVRNLCDLARQMPVEIIAHPTLMPAALLALEEDVEAWWTEEREDRFIEAAREAGVALEISNRYRLPHDRFLRKAREAGARFTLGSDGHTEAQIGILHWSVQAARRAGIGDADLFIAESRRKALIGR